MVLFNGLLTIKGCGFLEKRGGLHLGMLRRAQHEMLGTSRSVYGLELLPEEVGRM
jgi:hypothetical protein